MDLQKVMLGCVASAGIVLIIAFVCLFQGISAGVGLFVLTIVICIFVISIWILQYIGYLSGAPLRQRRIEDRAQTESLDDLKIRYAKGEITTDQFRQMKKDLQA